jgi:hypothetical protein
MNCEILCVSVIKTDENDPVGLTGLGVTNFFILFFQILNWFFNTDFVDVPINTVEYVISFTCVVAPALHLLVLFTVQENDIA